MKKGLLLLLAVLLIGTMFVGCTGSSDNEIDEALVGTWAWEADTDWTYILNADGTGQRGPAGEIVEFDWHVEDGALVLTAPSGLIRGTETWYYTINGRLLTLVNAEDASQEFNYIQMGVAAASVEGHALVGTWGWDANNAWTYELNADGTGTMGIEGSQESFTWWTTNDGGFYLDLGFQIHRWDYTIDSDDVLTLTSRQTDQTYSYVRLDGAAEAPVEEVEDAEEAEDYEAYEEDEEEVDAEIEEEEDGEEA